MLSVFLYHIYTCLGMFSTNLMITKTNFEKNLKICNFLTTGYKYGPISIKGFQNFRGNIFFS